MAVKSVEGIFRKLGYNKATRFLCDYVNERVCGVIGAPARSIVHLLETTRSKMSDSDTHADAAVRTFNEMQRRGEI
jgi:hypothetical protein